jgi:hypothetical protein
MTDASASSHEMRDIEQRYSSRFNPAIPAPGISESRMPLEHQPHHGAYCRLFVGYEPPTSSSTVRPPRTTRLMV